MTTAKTANHTIYKLLCNNDKRVRTKPSLPAATDMTIRRFYELRQRVRFTTHGIFAKAFKKIHKKIQTLSDSQTTPPTCPQRVLPTLLSPKKMFTEENLPPTN